MDNLIETINKLQSYHNSYNDGHIQFPQVVVVGSQSSGKSSILERITGCDILPKGSHIATRCPIILQLIHTSEQTELTAVFTNTDENTVIGVNNIRTKLQEMTNKIQTEGVTDSAIIIKLMGCNFPTLTLVDLPGIIKNDGNLPVGSHIKIQNITNRFVESTYAIILAISAANVDLANSDAVQVSKRFDSLGQRTLHVITKIDLMDDGTDARDILHSQFVTSSLGTVFLVNRSQKNVSYEQSMESAKEYEKSYLESKYGDISESHGIEALSNVLVKKLRNEIEKSLPDIVTKIQSRTDSLKSQIETMSLSDNDIFAFLMINRFIHNFTELIRGDGAYNSKELQGGAKISDILYNKFVKEITECCVSAWSKEEILTMMRNLTGNKKLSYSVEKPFVFLVQTEIDKFQKPSLDALKNVAYLLRQFVDETIREMSIQEYPNLENWLKLKVCKLIDERYQNTKSISERLIKCEKNDVFCTHPNNPCFTSSKQDMDAKIKKKHEEMFDDIWDSSCKTAKILVPLTVKLFVSVLYSNDTIHALQNITSLREFDFRGISNYEVQSKKSEIIKFVDENILYFSKLVETIAKTKLDDKVYNDLLVIALDEMIKKYFDMVRQNMIYNVPKWIQTFMIEDLFEEMPKHIYPLTDEGKQNLLKLSPKTEEKRLGIKEELLKLEVIEKGLQKCLMQM